MRAELTPLLQAAVTIIALRILHRLHLPAPTARQVVDALDVSRSRTYDLAIAIEAMLPALQRPPGRPPNPDDPDRDADTAFVTVCRVRDFLLANPGAATSGKRGWYSDAFRLFVLDLLGPDGPAHGMPLSEASVAIGVPEDTLASWLREPRPVPSAPRPTVPALSPSVVAQVLALWGAWSGTASAFRDALREQHRIDLSWHLLRSILELAGQRKARRRGAADLGEIRGALERFFPGAQLMADGKQLVVELDGVRHVVNWELAVDAATGAHVGFQVSAQEDGQAVVDAVDMALDTLDGPPLALLVDNRPSNHSAVVQDAMDERGIMLMPSTVGRPENKSTVEGAFGLFAQTMPDIVLNAQTPEELVRAVIFYVLWAFCAGRNQAPQSARGGKSALQLFAEATISDEDRQKAQQRLIEIKDRILARRDNARRHEDKVLRALVDREFADLGLDDPEDRFASGLVRTGMSAALEAIAIFRAKRDAGRLPPDFPERYLLGIARNVAERDEDLAVYSELLRLRVEAHDLMLAPLLAARAQLQGLTPIDYADAVLDRLRQAAATIDRRFWMHQLIELMRAMDLGQRLLHGPWLARRVAALFCLPRSERDYLIAALAQETAA